MFFSKEADIPTIDISKSRFAKVFNGKGPKDNSGRSLQDLKMNGRMFKYPFSYMVYSEAFNSLPNEAMDYIKRELSYILDPKNKYEAYMHLRRYDKLAIQRILADTTDLL